MNFQACQSAADKVAQQLGVLRIRCRSADKKKCVDDALKCNESKNTSAAAILENDGTGDDDCNEIQRMCPEHYAGSQQDAEKNKEAARTRRKELRSQLDELKGKSLDGQQKQMDDLNKADEDMQQNDENWRTKRKELTDKLQRDLKNIEDNKLKALREAQGEFDKIDLEYLKYRKEQRESVTTANNIEVAWNVECRAYADSVAAKAEELLDKRMSEEGPRNYSLTNSAGAIKRRLRMKRQRILNEYNKELGKCLRGEKDPGAKRKLELSQARRAIADNTTTANDRRARLENLKTRIHENLGHLKKSMDKETSMNTQQTQEAIQTLDQQHMARSQRAEKRKGTNMMMRMQQDAQQAEREKNLHDMLRDAEREEARSSTIYKCAVKITKEAADAIRTEKKAIADAAETIMGLCPNGPPSCSDPSLASYKQAVVNACRDASAEFPSFVRGSSNTSPSQNRTNRDVPQVD